MSVRLNGFTVCALTANSRIDVLEEQIRAFHPALAAVVDEEAAKDLRARVADTGTKVLARHGWRDRMRTLRRR